MNKYYLAVYDLITQYYKDREDYKKNERLGQYVINRLEKDLHSKMYPIKDGLATDSPAYYERNNVIAARSLMDTALSMGEAYNE